MSSKGRKVDPENVNEFYPTPRDAIVPLMETSLVTLPGGVWIEPCAGSGAIVETVNYFRSDVRWRLFEIDPRFEQTLCRITRHEIDRLAPIGDFLKMAVPWPGPWSKADVLIMNPPFNLTTQFVEAAFQCAGWVVMLQRSNWFGSKKRAPWFREHCPDLYTLPKRPSFTGSGTDSCEYGWFVWPPDGKNRRTGTMGMLGT